MEKDILENLPKATPKIDLNQAETLTCDACGSGLFEESFIIKIISPIVSPTGKEEAAPIPVFSCLACGAVPERFLKIATQAKIQ